MVLCHVLKAEGTTRSIQRNDTGMVKEDSLMNKEESGSESIV